MGASVRDTADGPSNRAQKTARSLEQEPDSAAVRTSDAAAPGDAVAGRTAWKRSGRPELLAGDVAVVNLRDKQALTPRRLPDPPSAAPSADGAKYRLVIPIVGVAVVTAVGAIGYELGSAPRNAAPQLALRSSHSDQQPLAADRSVAVSPLPSSPSASPAVAMASRDERELSGAQSSRAGSGRLTIGAMGPLQADEAARLTVSVGDAGPDSVVVIRGLAPGSTLSTGTQVGSNVWQLSLGDLAALAVTPPRGFTGAFDSTLELRRADGAVTDRKTLRLEWSAGRAPAASPPAGPPPRRLDSGEIAAMVRNGAAYMANGSVGAARMMLRPAAEAGDAAAAFALAETYDPLVLKQLNAQGGITADIGLAQAWYRKARDFGSAAAPERLERLARQPD